MSVKLTIEHTVVEGPDLRTVAQKLARHFGTIADGEPSDAGIAVAVAWEHVDDEPVEEPAAVDQGDEKEKG